MFPKYLTNLIIPVFYLVSLGTISAEDDEKQVCYNYIGCFQTDGPWFSKLLRPFPAPDSPNLVGTNIKYYNRELDDGVVVYNNSEITMENDGFKANRERTVFITHGFQATGNSSWMPRMKDLLLKKMDANIFIVDWGKGAETINYFQAASNARIAGAEIARFIKFLQEKFGLEASSIHLIGHSLGAHISSYAAKNITGISRLTGLDAAQPGFDGLSKEVRIDKSDADYVDLIHTNIRPTVPTLGFGIISPVGHVDIYMNGGVDQPGCISPDGINNIKGLSELGTLPFKVIGKWISCSHGRSYEYFTATLEAKCKIWARKSGKIRSLTNALTLGSLEPITSAIKKCSAEECTVVGLDAPKYEARGVFAATTIQKYPYCDESDPDYDKEVERQIQEKPDKSTLEKIPFIGGSSNKNKSSETNITNQENNNDKKCKASGLINKFNPFK